MKRNIHLDYLKIGLSILVLILHVLTYFKDQSLPAYLFFNGLARVSVPLFLMINGYFLAPIIIDQTKIKKYVGRLLILYTVWMLIYIPYFPKQGSLPLLAINGYHHLWYLVSLAEAAVLLFLLKKLKMKNSYLLIASFILFSLGWGIQKTAFFSLPDPISKVINYIGISRNFLFLGFPFLMLGYWLRNNGSRVQKWLFLSKYHYLLLGIFILCLLGESWFNYRIDRTKGVDFYFSLYPICLIIFLIFIRKPSIKVKEDIASNLATGIYLTHPLFIFIGNKTFLITDQLLLTSLVILASIMISFFLIILNRRIHVLL